MQSPEKARASVRALTLHDEAATKAAAAEPDSVQRERAARSTLREAAAERLTARQRRDMSAARAHE
jgi:hypothetical protein